MDITGQMSLGVSKFLNNIYNLAPPFVTLVLGLALLFGIYIILTRVVNTILKNSVVKKNEREKVILVWRYGYAFLAALILLFAFTGDLAATGISVGLITAALGWALQKPITGIAAWLMVVVKKPFRVGDRVIIGDIKGDVEKVETFYIMLTEIGGRFEGETKSGRTILIPTSTLFDVKIVNYSYGDEFVRDEIPVDFTYESNLLKAEEILVKAAEKITKDYLVEVSEKPFVLYSFGASAVCLRLRYFTRFGETGKVMSEITKNIYLEVIKQADLEFAYPHTEIVYKGKGQNAFFKEQTQL